MTQDYKYRHISSGRLKAIDEASSRLNGLRSQLKKSGLIAPEVLEQFRIVQVLLARAGAGPIELEDQELLKSILGKNIGNEKR